ncbi:non-homologous end-joining DNA ligase [Lentisalinibacter orientalis]|uniref:non-homologous end-joining DNA ligase n=1 Tax=Lentisalinibacter orientalis TaxID=2992241 RepID=UPI0038668574
MSEESRRLSFGRLVVETSSEDKVLYPDAGITKGDVIEYYRNVAEYALPWAADRFLTLQRFPDGLGEDGFYQQARAEYFPDYVEGVTADRVGGGEVEHIVVRNAAGLVYLANQGTLTIHAWLSRRDRLHHPDRMVIDLDPPDDDFGPVRDAARITADFLRELGLTPYVMTTGSRGLHVVVPLDRSADFDAVRDFARRAADLLAERHPDTLTAEQRKDKRKGRLYLDVMRNAYGQTAVMPYSLRAKPGAPVATPLAWDELGAGDLTAQRYHIGNLFRRLGQIEDPWADMKRHAAGIAAADEALSRL